MGQLKPVIIDGKLPTKCGNFRKRSVKPETVFAIVFEFFCRFLFRIVGYHFHFRLSLNSDKISKTILDNRQLSLSLSSLPTTQPPPQRSCGRPAARAPSAFAASVPSLPSGRPDGLPREGGRTGGAGRRRVAILRGVRPPLHGAQPPRRSHGSHLILAGPQGLDSLRVW